MTLYNTGIRPLVDAYLKAESEKIRDYGDYWSASSAGFCMRYLIMKRLGVPPVPEREEDLARTTRVFESGHVFHRWMQDITINAGISIAQEMKLQDEELMVRGHFDDLVKVGDNLILYDYKTAHSKWFDYKKNESMGHLHRMQLGTYMYMLRISTDFEKAAWVDDKRQPNINFKDVAEARILSISKDDLRLAEQRLDWSDGLQKDVFSFWSTLNGYWAKKTLPRCTCLLIDDGWFGRRSKRGKIYNDFFYEEEPCSLKWYKKFKQEEVKSE